MPNNPTTPHKYRPNVGMMIVNNDNLIFAGERVAKHPQEPYSWQMPQGGRDGGETLEETITRELLEETGITDNIQVLHQHPQELIYDWEEAARKDGDIYIGQRQTWFLLRYTGNPIIDLTKATDDEFSDYKWVDHHFLIENCLNFRKPIYEQVFAEFLPLLS